MIKQITKQLFEEYKVEKKDQEKILNIISDIIKHPEFKKRMQKPFMHHDKITLGQHIIEDAVITYKLIQKSHNKYDLKIAILIAMFHDLYTYPWQNNKANDVSRLRNKHGFRHPIEAVINALNWYPEYFNDDNAFIIIDGIIHHMFPFPVDALIDIDENYFELTNFDSIKNIKKDYLEYIFKSCQRKMFLNLSWSRARSKEGRIVSKADKKVSINNFKKTKICSKIALLTGKNKHLDN